MNAKMLYLLKKHTHKYLLCEDCIPRIPQSPFSGAFERGWVRD